MKLPTVIGKIRIFLHKLADFELKFRLEGIKYQWDKYIYSERSILVLSENHNRFHLWPLELYFRGPRRLVLFGVPAEAVPSPVWLKKWQKITSPAFLSTIFGFLVLKNFPGPIFRVIGAIFLPQFKILWGRVPPSRHLAMAVFWPRGLFLAGLKNRVPKHPRIWNWVFLPNFGVSNSCPKEKNFWGGWLTFSFFLDDLGWNVPLLISIIPLNVTLIIQ